MMKRSPRAQLFEARAMNSIPLPQAVSVESIQQSATVLVVDDFRSMCELIAEMLRPRGYRVLMASSGAEAKACARYNARIDLLLTDLEMPEMRGDELALWFRAARPETRILFMSSQNAVRAPEPVHFLPKPFRAEALVSKVREVLNHSSAPSAETAAA